MYHSLLKEINTFQDWRYLETQRDRKLNQKNLLTWFFQHNMYHLVLLMFYTNYFFYLLMRTISSIIVKSNKRNIKWHRLSYAH